MPYRDKKDQAKAAHRHYLKNKEKIKKRAQAHDKIAKHRNKEYVDNYKATHPCVDCGEKDIEVLEFDHLHSKTGNIGRMVTECRSLEVIKAEIEKCEVRCANCHRKMTIKRRRAHAG